MASGERVGRVLEGMEILRRLWSEEKVTHKGRFFQFEEVDALPKPVQARVPLWLAVNPKGDYSPELMERVLRRVAKHSDGWQTDAISLTNFGRDSTGYGSMQRGWVGTRGLWTRACT